MISGLHTSINIHLCSNFLLQDGLTSPGGTWGPNKHEFHRRFSPEGSGGEGPQWLKNLYFLYLLELRALAKASDALERADFYTGKSQEDGDLQLAVRDLLKVNLDNFFITVNCNFNYQVVRSFPEHFDESSMFTGGEASVELKRDFQDHFRNITRVMDCVGCDKCRLWGKLQIMGIGTALKILFSPSFDQNSLQRQEIVSLFNSFGR